ncbi:MAG: hypothetical protein PHC34_05260 [Candidatus Gastranaerophilales bacterium]|nr:hypothetical protein [Candidatus Gastranaerophilales bacterium]
MNIEQIQITDKQTTDGNTANNEAITNNANIAPKSAQSLAFKLEMPNNKSFIDFLSLGLEDLQDVEQLGNPEQSISLGKINKLNPTLIKNLQAFAMKNNIPLRIKDINDARLLVYSQNLFNNGKEPGIKINDIEKSDIDFLKKCADNPNIFINSINPQNMSVNYTLNNNNNIEGQLKSEEVSYKSLNISKSLVNLIDYASKTQKPVRLDFEGNSTVILKVDKEGKLTAEFISSDRAMESLLKNSIPQLRNKMDNEGIPYKNISYKEQSQKNNSQQEEKSYE